MTSNNEQQMKSKRLAACVNRYFQTWQTIIRLTSCRSSASRRLFLATFFVVCCFGKVFATDELDSGFVTPPDSAKPQTWWHWVDGRVNTNTVTAELEALKAIGVGGVQMFMAGRGPTPANETPCLSPKWKDAVRHAVAECDRLGLELTAQNAPGWSGAGGPWITPDRAMFLVESQENRVSGGQTVTLPSPPSWPEKGNRFYRDIAILAFPTPPAVREAKPLPDPTVTASFPCDRLALLNRKEVSRNLYRKNKEADMIAVEAKEPRTDWIQFEFPEPVTVRCVTIASFGCIEPDAQRPVVEASDDGKNFRAVVQLASYACFYNCELDDVEHAVPATTARFFRLVWPDRYQVRLSRVQFSGHPAISGLAGKTGRCGRTFVDEPALPEEPDAVIDPKTLIDLTDKKDAKGDLVWTAPPGDWTVLRIGYRNKTRCNMPAPSEGSGLECDKFDAEVASFHFDQYMGLILNEARACGSKAVKGILLDSWEAETQNWTHKFPKEFTKRRGYDVKPWLPAYAGYIVGNRDLTERYLRDARQTCNDLLMANFFDVIRRRAHENGLEFYAESCGGSGAGTMVADAVEHYLHVDIPMTEGGRPMREAVSAAHLTGNPLVAMEAHTSRASWDVSPRTFKGSEDTFFSLGISRIIFHTYAHNPDPDRLYPGPAFWSYGATFSRGQTWWPMGKGWITYLSRCQYLLQRGRAVADVLACYGEETLGPLVKIYKKRERGSGYTDALDGLPSGYEYDLLPANFLIRDLDVRPDGSVSAPDGSVYRLILLYKSDRVTPELLRKVKTLVAKGATVLGPRPVASVSLSGYPACDDEIRQIADELWGNCDGKKVSEHAYGKGRVLCGMTLKEALERLSIPPDFSYETKSGNADVRYIHRRDGDAEIYFLSNQTHGAIDLETSFRVSGKMPEIWDPITGRMRDAVAFRQEDGRTLLPLHFARAGSVFVVFRKPIATDAAATATNNEPSFHAELTVKGPWTVSFTPGWGAPESVTFATLDDWSKRSEPGIKYYSGTAVYRTTFDWKTPLPKTARLDLGDVAVLAGIKLNGKDCGVAWTMPYCLDISKTLQPGRNELEIQVANTWANRLIGEGRVPNSTLHTWTTYHSFTPESPLRCSGLLGPVTIQIAK